jgi:hypothetical protein
LRELEAESRKRQQTQLLSKRLIAIGSLFDSILQACQPARG